MKKLMGLWIFVVVILISGLTCVGYLIKNENKVYKVLENELEEVAQGYFGENPGLLSNNKIVQDTELGSYKEEILTKLKENDCKGYVKTTSNLGIYEVPYQYISGHCRCPNVTMHVINNFIYYYVSFE